jgi:hypothetical protein
MYEYIRNNKSLIPLDMYEVASSPIFIHLFGFSLLIFGSFYEQFISVTYIVMSIVSIFIFEKLIREASINIKLILIVAFCGSGYFVAPMLYPTSETPTILFLALSLYAYLKTCNRKLLAFSIFSLVSVRQSMGWVLIVFILWDLNNWWKSKGITLKNILFTYLLAGLSLIFTFVYFNYHLFPDLYIEVQPGNVFPLPNFLSTMQIGIGLLVSSWPFWFYNFRIKKLEASEKLFLFFISLITLFSLFFTQNIYIGKGLGYLSILNLDFKLNLNLIVFLSYVGFLSVLLISKEYNSVNKNFAYLFIVIFSVSSLVMPIPYLRYFQIPIIFILAILFGGAMRQLDRSKTRHLFLIFLFFNLTNLLTIAV